MLTFYEFQQRYPDDEGGEVVPGANHGLALRRSATRTTKRAWSK